MKRIHPARPVKDPAVRNQLMAMFNMSFDDKEIASALRLSIYKVRQTRSDMGLTRSTAPKPRLSGGYDTTGMKYRKSSPTNSNARVCQFQVFRAFLDQTGNKNMSEIARQFGCSRAYVSGVIMKARKAGLIYVTNRFYQHDENKLVRTAMEKK